MVEIGAMSEVRPCIALYVVNTGKRYAFDSVITLTGAIYELNLSTDRVEYKMGRNNDFGVGIAVSMIFWFN